MASQALAAEEEKLRNEIVSGIHGIFSATANRDDDWTFAFKKSIGLHTALLKFYRFKMAKTEASMMRMAIESKWEKLTMWPISLDVLLYAEEMGMKIKDVETKRIEWDRWSVFNRGLVKDDPYEVLRAVLEKDGSMYEVKIIIDNE